MPSFSSVYDLYFHLTFSNSLSTGYIDKGLLVKKTPKMLIHYIKSRAFKLDVASLIPFDLLYLIPAVGPGYLIVRLNRILRFHRVFQFFYQEESRTNYPNVLRIINLLMYLSLFIHWNACFYFLISKGIGFGSDEWVRDRRKREEWMEYERQREREREGGRYQSS